MEYAGTRGAQAVSAQQAIVRGLAPDGGLYAPVALPHMDFLALEGSSYQQVALALLERLLPDFGREFLQEAIAQSYGSNFGGKTGHVETLAPNLYALELWHGPTCAFKDYALQLMPRLLLQAKTLTGDEAETLILVATSGDTGKAALEGFKNLPGVRVVVFYPKEGTSEIQRLQMVTQEGNNVAVVAVNGNFDDAQKGVKRAFSSSELAEKLEEKGVRLSSANSINWGRLVPQLVYYVYSYLQLCQNGAVRYGQPVDYYVPTGNFGDILAGYYAKAMGLPVGKLVCASNKNNVLADFINTGRYDTHRTFYKTSSPSMDILVSSNLERLLWHAGGSAQKVTAWMEDMAKSGVYQVDADTLKTIQDNFDAGWADEEQVSAEIKQVYDEYGYLCDPHTAVAFRVLRNKGLARPSVVLSTASPFKFSGKVLQALGQTVPSDEFEALCLLQSCTGQPVPAQLMALKGQPVRFNSAVEPGQIEMLPLTL